MSTSRRLLNAGGLLTCAALFLAGLMPMDAHAANLCWKELIPTTEAQDIRLATTEPSLATIGSDEAWLSWQENGSRIFHWHKGKWSAISSPEFPGTETVRYPVVATDPSGTVVLAVSANGEDGVSALHISRWTDAAWQPLGAPLLSKRLPFTHAHEAAIGFVDTHPVVAWSEERDVTLAGLFVAQWDGASWQRLGTLAPEGDSYYLFPTITVDADKRIWIAWKEGDGKRLRVSFWDGSVWHDVGRESLQQIAFETGNVDQPSLVVDSKGHAWITWGATQRSGDSLLAVAHWNGNKWQRVSAPCTPGDNDKAAWLPKVILRGDRPTVVWSQTDDTYNRRLYVAELMDDDRWTLALSGLHLVEGVSNVSEINVSAGDAKSFFIAWDESGRDHRRTRLVKVYTCAEAESPAAAPPSLAESVAWPTTVKDAAERVAEQLDADSKERLQSTKKEDLISYHFGLGTGIRNDFGLWRGNGELLKSCGDGEFVHPDSCSMIIIKAVWELLHASDTKGSAADNKNP